MQRHLNLNNNMKRFRLFFEILRPPVDFLATIAAFFAAYRIRPITDLIPGVHFKFVPEQLPAFGDYVGLSILASLFLLFVFVFNGLYSINPDERFGRTVLKIIFSVSTWLMLIIAYYFLVIHELFFSRVALAQIWLFAIVFIVVGRTLIFLIQNRLHHWGFGKTKVLFIGVGPFVEAAYQALRRDPKYHIVGALTDEMSLQHHPKLPIIGALDAFETVAKKYHVDEIIHADSSSKEVTSEKLLAFCRANHVHYYMIPEVLRLQSVNVEMEMIDGIPLISLKQTRLEGWGRVYKRIFDLIFSLVIIILLLPVWLIVGFLIKIDSHGPVFYGSKRRYRDKTFTIYKFRSMEMGAEDKRAELLDQNERKGPLFKIKNDPRVTRLGRFLRKTSLDELPQFFNVFLGTLSVVGPRPHLPEEVDQYQSHHLRVFALKPGVTGLAQINGRSHLDFEDEIKLDFYYIENWSLRLDLKIMLKTIAVVLRADGH